MAIYDLTTSGMLSMLAIEFLASLPCSKTRQLTKYRRRFCQFTMEKPGLNAGKSLTNFTIECQKSLCVCIVVQVIGDQFQGVGALREGASMR